MSMARNNAGEAVTNYNERADKSNYLTDGFTLKSWLLTKDHKRIAVLYLISVAFFFLLGGISASLLRLELLTPKGDLMTDDMYNKFFTAHGILMVFFVVIPGVPAILGNFLIPLMIGAKDLAFPRLNLASWYVYTVAGILGALCLILGGVDTGWTFYAPYSTTYSNSYVILAGLAAFAAGFSSIFTGMNFIVTIHKMRAPGLTWMRLPLFVWAHYATSLIIILGTPVVAMTIVLLALERLFHIGIFDPRFGGDPVLFQHLFWFYSHPAVYIMILPSMGIISELFAAFSRRRIFGYEYVAFSSLAIAAFGFLVWGHHLFVAGQSTYAGMYFSIITMLVAIPSAVKVFNWTATLYKGSIDFKTPLLYAIGFMGLFAIGGLTGIFLATMGLDVHVHDTYFVVAHFHYVMVGGAIMGFMGGIHYWWPKISGRLYNDVWGKIGACLIFTGFNLTFFPQFIAGYLGMPRRYHAYPPEFQTLNVLSTGGAAVLGIGFLIPIVMLGWSFFRGERAGSNPWGAKGLEWETTSPPPTENFPVTPVVTEEAYAYGDPHAS